jgi:hypothetical protein
LEKFRTRNIANERSNARLSSLYDLQTVSQ